MSPSSIRALRRKVQQAQRHGIDGLIHGNTNPPGAPRRTAEPQVLQIVQEVLASQPQRAKTSQVTLLRLIRARLLRDGVETKLSDYRLKQLIGEHSRAMDLHLEAKGRERVALKPQVVYGSRVVSRPGEVVQVDATTTNIHVFDPRCGWIRAVVLTAIDVFSRCILALRVVTNAPTSRDVAMLVWDIGRPVVTRSGYPYELVHHHGVPRLIAVNSDPCDPEEQELERIGIKPALTPSVIVMDHGKEFDSVHLISALARVGIDIDFCGPRAAHAKGVIESFHNVLREIQSLLPAYKGANVNNHPRGWRTWPPSLPRTCVTRSGSTSC